MTLNEYLMKLNLMQSSTYREYLTTVIKSDIKYLIIVTKIFNYFNYKANSFIIESK